jgi:hypothetical protein
MVFLLLVKLHVLQFMVLTDLVLTLFLILLSSVELQPKSHKKLTSQDKLKENCLKELEKKLLLTLTESEMLMVLSQLLKSD